MGLRDKICVVTGASAGIGAAVAAAFAGRGAAVRKRGEGNFRA